MLVVVGVLLLILGFFMDIFGMLVLLFVLCVYFVKQLMSCVVVGNIYVSGAGFEQFNFFYDCVNLNGMIYEGEFECKDD